MANKFKILVFVALFFLWSPFLLAAKKDSVDSSQLETRIAKKLSAVNEFAFVRQEAERLGVRAWLFGGTASGFAHYNRWDMLREQGSPLYQPDRFDYDYTNIYRSTQDLDIVIDGDAEAAKRLEESLRRKYPHLQGSKSVWEVRLLRENMGDKLAILDNPDFLNQHTDSNSTGMIELTKPPTGEPIVRDVRDWKAKQPVFLQDVAKGELHYYFSPKHDKTAFYKAGRNPPIISVIRYLTKAFQYELDIPPESRKQIQKIIKDFDPDGVEMKNSYVRNWLLKKDNGRKLIQNAVNMEYAWDTLEQLGLRKKLIAVEGNPSAEGSLAWWMNKEPLRSTKIGAGKGKTAAQLGLDVIAHETDSFLSYESITRAHTGDANLLVSRRSAKGEAALYGEGAYARVGTTGARGTGLTIRMHLDPNAREGTDFVYVEKKDYVVIKNKNAVKVIPESLNMTPLEYVRFILEGNEIDRDDRAIYEKLRRRAGTKLSAIPEEEFKQIEDLILKSRKANALLEAVNLLTSAPADPRVSKVLSLLVKRDQPELLLEIAKSSYCAKLPQCIDAIKKAIVNPSANFKGDAFLLGLAEDVFTQPWIKDQIDLVHLALNKGDNKFLETMLEKAFQGKSSLGDVELRMILSRADEDLLESMARRFLRGNVQSSPEFMDEFLKKLSPRILSNLSSELRGLVYGAGRNGEFLSRALPGLIGQADLETLKKIPSRILNRNPDPDLIRLVLERASYLAESDQRIQKYRNPSDPVFDRADLEKKFKAQGMSRSEIDLLMQNFNFNEGKKLREYFPYLDMPALTSGTEKNVKLALTEVMDLPVEKVNAFLVSRLGPGKYQDPLRLHVDSCSKLFSKTK